MKKSIVLLTAASSLLALAMRANAQVSVSPKPSEVQIKAQKVVALLGKEDYATAVKDFDKTMTDVLPARKLEDLWKSVTSKVGAFKKQLGVRQERVGKYDVALVTCQFEKMKLDVRVVLDADRHVAGLAFAAAKSLVPYKAPAYVDPKAYRETEVKLGQDKWVLPGTLTLPVGNGPFPAVVLVHGSGPNDRDETIGPNKVFRDLAWGLASRGIAVLRYEKRSREHGTRMVAAKSFPTLAEGVTDDAVAAVKLLGTDKSVDAKRIYVLGHSLGGTLAPQIGVQAPSVAGLICLAGATLPVEDHVLRQFKYLYTLDGPISDEHKKELARIEQQVARLKDPKLSTDVPAKDLLLGVPASYWLALRQAMPGQVMRRVKQPMLILQGERDYQVTMADFEEWKKLVAGRTNVRTTSYPKLNHLFMEGQGKSKPTEYAKAGHVAKEVIEDIAAWIKGGR
jgi:fermentation-respiration switch protein FrsA (DUF1100 family)